MSDPQTTRSAPNSSTKRRRNSAGSIESATAADYIPNMTSLARSGYDLVIGVGFAQGDAIGKVAHCSGAAGAAHAPPRCRAHERRGFGDGHGGAAALAFVAMLVVVFVLVHVACDSRLVPRRFSATRRAAVAA